MGEELINEGEGIIMANMQATKTPMPEQDPNVRT